MKRNLLLIDRNDGEPSPELVSLGEALAGDFYVYLQCPGCGFREDSPGGVRFVSNEFGRPPGFGRLDAVVAFRELDGRQSRLADVCLVKKRTVTSAELTRALARQDARSPRPQVTMAA